MICYRCWGYWRHSTNLRGIQNRPIPQIKISRTTPDSMVRHEHNSRSTKKVCSWYAPLLMEPYRGFCRSHYDNTFSTCHIIIPFPVALDSVVWMTLCEEVNTSLMWLWMPTKPCGTVIVVQSLSATSLAPWVSILIQTIEKGCLPSLD